MRPSQQTGAPLAIVSVCFFLSGFAGLALETAWSRALALHVGGSAEGVTAVVTAYMAGLGLGSLLVSGYTRRLARPLRLYALLEIAVAAFALLSPFVLRAPEGLYRIAHDYEEVSRVLPFAVRFVTSLVLLLIPTMAMGATLPLLVESLTRRDDRYASGVAWLYGINTLGAVAGTAITGFVLLPRYGNMSSLMVAAAVDVAVALVLWGMKDLPPREAKAATPAADPAPAKRADAGTGKRADAGSGKRAAAEHGAARRGASVEALSPRLRRVAMFGFAVSGALAMTYELGWTRRLATLIGSSVYSFTLLLATFLAGLALGAICVGPFAQRTRRPLAWLGTALGLTGLFALLGTSLLQAIPNAFRDLLVTHAGDPRAILAGEMGLAALVLLPAALLLGAIFPLAARALRREHDDPGHAVGQVYAVNTAGTVIGAAGAGLVALPLFGSIRTLEIAALVHTLLGMALVLGSRWARAWRLAVAGALAAGFVAIVVITPPPDLYRLNYGVVSLLRDLDRGGGPPPDRKALESEDLQPVRVLSMEEGRSATVAVVTTWETRTMVINGKIDAANSDPTQVLLGQLPMILANTPKKALVIGFGSGITTHSVLTHPIERVETVEIEPAVVRAGRFFSDLNGRDRPDPRSVLFFEDGRTHLTYTRSLYDVIVSEPSNPWIAGINNLFTREFYALVKRRLTPNGLFCQWVHMYELSDETAASLLATLNQSFPGARVYRQNNDFLVIWSRNGARLTRSRLDRAFADPRVRGDLASVGLESPSDVLALDLGALADVAPAGGRFNTDDNGFVEFRAPLDLLRRGDTQPWRLPSVAALDLATYDPEGEPRVALLELWEGASRRRDLERMRAIAGAVERLSTDAENDSMRAAITRLETARAAAPRVATLMRASDEAFQAQDYRGCSQTLSEALALTPDDPDLLVRYARAALAVGATADAERALREALAAVKDQKGFRSDATIAYQSHLMLGMVAASGGRHDQALGHYDDAQALNPHQVGAHVMRARTLQAMGRHDDALRATAAGLAVDPRNRALLALQRSVGPAK